MAVDPIDAQGSIEAPIPRTLTYVDVHGERRVVTEDELADLEKPLVVLGEPGMGKTFLLTKLGMAPDHELVTAKGLLRRDPARSVAADRVLVIDALDEVASARSDDPIQLVLRQLAALGSPPFILSCRSADWRSAIAKHDIGEDYGRAPLELRLNPFTDDDALTWLSSRIGPDRARRTIEQLNQRGLEALLGNPLMLKLVSQLARQDGSLPGTRTEVFEGACDRLWAEPNARYTATALNGLNRAQALDAAGAAFAALLLTGSEALSREAAGHLQPGDLRISEVAELPGAGPIEIVLGSMLFQRPGERDRFTPLHRTIAEFLGARWLAGQATPANAKRIMALLTYNGGVPASLRGLHAWLAHFSRRLAPEIIRNDCYGVLRYGDADRLSVTEGDAMLDALKALSVRNPYFRSEDWARHRAQGLMHPELAEKVRTLVLAPDSAPQLRTLLLDALKGSPAAAHLRDDLFNLMMTESPDAFHHGERISAAEALIALKDPTLDWSATVETLTRRTSAEARHLAVDILLTEGVERFAPAVIVDAALAYLGRLPGVEASTEVESVGPLYYLSRKIPDGMIAAVLDRFLERNPPERASDWKSDYAANDFVTTLISRQLAVQVPQPARLWAWLGILSRHRSHTGEERRRIHEFVRSHADLRRAVQELALLAEPGEETPWARAWELQQAETGLMPDADDIVVLLSSPHLTPLTDPGIREKWKDIVRLGARREGLPEPVLDVASQLAAGDVELSAFLDELREPKAPKWELDQRKREAAEAKRREIAWAKHRVDFGTKHEAIRAGELGWILPLAQAYRGEFNDMDSSATPEGRIRHWLGEDILESARIGFEAVLHRNDLPGSQKIAESYGQSKRWNFIIPILVGLLQRMGSGQGLDGVPEDVILSGRLGCEWELSGDAAEGKALKSALDDWLVAHPGSFEIYARLLIEPQLTKTDENAHVSGLYQLTRQEDVADIVTRLAQQWLASFPSMPATAEIELIDHLARFQAWPTLRAAAQARRAAGYRNEEHRRTWLAAEFLTDFAGFQADLATGPPIDPDLMWHLRRHGGHRRADPSDAGGALPRLVWLIRTFRSLHKATGRPTGTTSGNENAWDASEYLQGAIAELASDTSDAAIAALADLRDETSDGYTNALRKASADQLQARREAEFEPLELSDLAAVLHAAPPTTIQDLRAIALQALETVQRQVRGDDVDTARLFYEGSTPLAENRCRNVLTTLLRGVLPFEIDCVPERAMPNGKRADLALTIAALQLPLEAKGQWNPQLWTGATDQLDRLYTKEWRASGAGIYLVFWFGPHVADGRKLKGPPKGIDTPTSPEALEAALFAGLPELRRADLSIFVFDVSL